MDKDIYRITTEDAEGITFATRHKWNQIHSDQLNELNGYTIIGGFFSSCGIYHIMRDSSPMNFPEESFKLVKHSIDEETGRGILLSMDVTREEATELIKNERQIW